MWILALSTVDKLISLIEYELPRCCFLHLLYVLCIARHSCMFFNDDYDITIKVHNIGGGGVIKKKGHESTLLDACLLGSMCPRYLNGRKILQNEARRIKGPSIDRPFVPITIVPKLMSIKNLPFSRISSLLAPYQSRRVREREQKSDGKKSLYTWMLQTQQSTCHASTRQIYWILFPTPFSLAIRGKSPMPVLLPFRACSTCAPYRQALHKITRFGREEGWTFHVRLCLAAVAAAAVVVASSFSAERAPHHLLPQPYYTGIMCYHDQYQQQRRQQQPSSTEMQHRSHLRPTRRTLAEGRVDRCCTQ